MKKLYIRNQSEEMTLKELFEQFLVAKQCINVSPYTLRFYEGCYSTRCWSCNGCFFCIVGEWS